METERLLRRTERWFVRQGVPQLIADYGFRSHLLPRLVRSVSIGAAIIAAGGVLAATVGVAAPVVVAVALVALGAWPVLAALAIAYGLFPLAVQATRHAWSDMRGSLRLQGRALPTLLFVTFFLFFTAELWQLMDHLAWGQLTLVLVLFAAVTVLATSARLREEVDRVEHDLNPDRLASACTGTPLSGCVPGDVPAPSGLTARQETNLLLVLATRQLVQAAVVGIGLFAFFLLLGVLVVDRQIAAAWIGTPAKSSVWLPFLPAALPRAAALLAGFGSMYFAITAMTQTEYRRDFFDPVIGDVERMLAVRAVYLALRTRAAGVASAPLMQPVPTQSVPVVPAQSPPAARADAERPARGDGGRRRRRR